MNNLARYHGHLLAATHGYNQPMLKCNDCGSLIADTKVHNRFHWRLDPRRELSVGDEIYIRIWSESTEDGRMICSRATVSGFDESVIRVERSGRRYYFEYEDVFPADPAYGFDPYEEGP